MKMENEEICEYCMLDIDTCQSNGDCEDGELTKSTDDYDWEEMKLYNPDLD